MSDWRHLLRDALDERDGDALSDDDAIRMRKAILEAAQRNEAPPFSWWRPVAVAAATALMIASGVVGGRWIPVTQQATVADAPAAPEVSARRQVQFSTPGGTRIIWTIDPDFHLSEVHP